MSCTILVIVALSIRLTPYTHIDGTTAEMHTATAVATSTSHDASPTTAATRLNSRFDMAAAGGRSLILG